MVNEEVVRNTIQKMREAGLSEQVISSTLTDLGLSFSQTQAFLSGAGTFPPGTGKPSPPSPSSSFRSEMNDDNAMTDLDHEVIASRTSEKVVQRLDERSMLNHEEQSLKDNITHLALEQHGQQLRDTHQAVVELHDKMDATNLDTLSNRVSTLNVRADQIQKDVSDAKALMEALQTLMQKILETNQQILFEIKTKKG
jgi:hypothetical protein